MGSQVRRSHSVFGSPGVKVTPLYLPGAFLIEIDPASDERGFFARTWCEEELASHGLDTRIAQCSVSFNQRRGTLRGMHYQAAPREEAKLVRCTQGIVYDVLLDLRPHSPTYCKWTAKELSARNRRSVYVPPGIAHGFQTLSDEAELFYQISQPFAAALAQGVRWDDPAFDIAWPEPVSSLSNRDRHYPDFRP